MNGFKNEPREDLYSTLIRRQNLLVLILFVYKTYLLYTILFFKETCKPPRDHPRKNHNTVQCNMLSIPFYDCMASAHMKSTDNLRGIRIGLAGPILSIPALISVIYSLQITCLLTKHIQFIMYI